MLKQIHSLIILIWIVPHISCQWVEPFFLDANSDNVTFRPPNFIQDIYAFEGIPTPFTIALINYGGSEVPKLGGFISGFSSEIEITFEKPVGESYYRVIVNKFQDFEQITDKFYNFAISIGSVQKTIILYILNLIDTPPTVEYESPCQVDELLPPNTNTRCYFSVYVADGFTWNNYDLQWDNEITAEINTAENTLFEFKNINNDILTKTSTFELVIKQTLRFEEKPLYIFRTNFKNTMGFPTSILTIIELVDKPSMPPKWITSFGVETFNEKLYKEFPVEAVDGDTGIDDDIKFRIEFDADVEDEYKKLIFITDSTERNKAIIHLPSGDKPGIDRDLLQKEIFRFDIVAYKPNGATEFANPSRALIVIQDINDQTPLISILNDVDEEITEIWIEEETLLTLPIHKIIVNDGDLETNALYEVRLDNTTSYSAPFNIVPQNGYQRSDFFKINVFQDEGLLDYEDTNWRSFDIILVARETDTSENFEERRKIRINLNNWNDELPIFEKNDYTVTVREDIKANEIILPVKANDRDDGDEVIHSILGNLGDLLAIDADNGEISTKIDDTFDYEKQTQVILQVMAKDKLSIRGEATHEVFAQVTINIEDVNDETPEIKMPPTQEIKENVLGNVLLPGLIKATDPDTTALLEFTILWDESRATKSGQTVKPEHYEGCFIIEKKVETVPNNNVVWGELKVNPGFVNPKVKDIDYEKFEVIYLTIQVNDTKQYINEGSASAELTIRITDLNDNPPQFIDPTLSTERNVLEAALANTQIGTILAEDIDGPDNNVILYSMRPTDSEVPADWITIDEKGIIRVDADQSIDCDADKLYYLEYMVTLFDGVHETKDIIQIYIIDTNNKYPQIPPLDGPIIIKEKVTETGEFLTQIIATDDDRDLKHRDFIYQIETTYVYIGNYFEINRTSGVLSVKLIGETKFDFDKGDKSFDIPIEIFDSSTSIVNRGKVVVRVNLTDVNDHAPEFVLPYSPKIEENSNIGDILDELCATDEDSDLNALVNFKLISIEPFEGVSATPPTEKLFKIFENRKNCMQLQVASSLTGYYGIWEVVIHAIDNGFDDDLLEQTTPGTFYVEISPFNYNDPEIRYPLSSIIRLSDVQTPGDTLDDLNKEPFKPFEASDPDGGKFGEVEFRITPTLGQDATDVDYFEFQQIDVKKSNLILKKPIGDKKMFYITCTAYDGGERSSNSLPLEITFVNVDGEPYFTISETFAFFKENDKGLSDSFELPEGVDPINLGLPPEQYQKIYYFLAKTDSYELFNLDRESRFLTLKQPLDKNEQEKHIVRIVLSRNEENPPSTDVSTLLLNILVVGEDATIGDEKPKIFYPSTNSLRLLAGQSTNINLLDTTNSVLRSFEAYGRNDDMSISQITFEISNVPGESEDAKYFKFSPVDKTLANLELAETIDHPNPYNIRITAVNALQQSEPLDLKIIFVDMNREPYFEISEHLVFIPENATGLTQVLDIPTAIEPRNEGLDENLSKIYYFIDSTYNPDDALKFQLDPDTNKLSLREMLDREVKENHEIRIVVTRLSSGPSTNPSTTSLLLQTIMVLDVNDNPPVFELNLYPVGITTSDRLNKTLLQVRANDLDLNETITYRMVDGSFTATGDGISAVEPSSFLITSENNLGIIKLNFVPRVAMTGYFRFEIEARDNDYTHSGFSTVKIYIIADANRVTFVFVNTLSDIEFLENSQFIVDLFTDKFKYECIIDEAQSATDDNGVPKENLTNVIVHFIENNEAVPAETIQSIVSDVVFITQLKSILAQKQLILQEVPTSSSVTDDTTKAELLQTILIVLSVVLGIICAILIVAFYLRTRNLRRQLKAFSTVQFGSTSSNLNRTQAPTTNGFSVEGSNPVLNNNNLNPRFDNISVHSDDSDFAGIQNDVTFQSRKESINPQMVEEMRRKSINPMINGNANSLDGVNGSGPDSPGIPNRRESINPQIIEEIRRKSINPMVNGKSIGLDSNL